MTAHLIVPFARGLPPDDDPSAANSPLHANPGGPQALLWPRAADTPNLHALLQQAAHAQLRSGSPHSFTPPHEWALAHALGHLPTVAQAWDDDTALPWASVQADGSATAAAWVHPVHQQVGMDQVTLQPLADLDPAHDRALLAALAPLAAEDGLSLRWDRPGRWLAQGEPLAGVTAASLDRVSGRSVAGWLPRGDRSAALRRLMAEAQMLFYTHPAHDERQQRGQLPVNAIWLSGCGQVPGWTPQPQTPPPPHAPGAPAAPESPPRVTVADALRAPALAGDAAGWHRAWAQLDAEHLGPWRRRVRQGEPLVLSLCGEQGWLALHHNPPAHLRPGVWSRWRGDFLSFFGRSRTAALVFKL